MYPELEKSRFLSLLIIRRIALTNQGRWDDAEKLQVQVMETFTTMFGADHPYTLTSMNNLAFTWRG
jgi:hypothetical protein